MSTVVKKDRRSRIKISIRKRLEGTTERPRLSVFRSNSNVYAQIIDDSTGKTLVAASSISKSVKPLIKEQKPVEISVLVGKEIAKLAIEKGINTVVFDRNGFLYHGRIKAIADGAREGGLQF